jgi:hypothetical protein
MRLGHCRIVTCPGLPTPPQTPHTRRTARLAADECSGGPPRWSTGKRFGGAAFGLIAFPEP